MIVRNCDRSELPEEVVHHVTSARTIDAGGGQAALGDVETITRGRPEPEFDPSDPYRPRRGPLTLPAGSLLIGGGRNGTRLWRVLPSGPLAVVEATCGTPEDVYAAVAVAKMKDTETVIADLEASGDPEIERAAAHWRRLLTLDSEAPAAGRPKRSKRNRGASRRRLRAGSMRAAA